jgi:TetR/AcrR family transcriptional regulator
VSDTRTAILKVATTLFANKGYDGVSMRNIADDLKISAPALYNHFKDKQSLYMTAIAETFENKSEQYILVLDAEGEPLTRLKNVIELYSKLLHSEPDFHRLIQRELLDGDEKRLEYLAKEVFAPAFNCMKHLLLEIKPECDPGTLVIFITGMIHKHFDLKPLLKYLPDSKQEHNSATYITDQVMAVLLAYLERK